MISNFHSAVVVTSPFGNHDIYLLPRSLLLQQAQDCIWGGSFPTDLEKMSRVYRVALVFGICAIFYFLALFQYFSVPFVDDKVLQEVLPLVSSFRALFYDFWFEFSFHRACLALPRTFSIMADPLTRHQTNFHNITRNSFRGGSSSCSARTLFGHWAGGCSHSEIVLKHIPSYSGWVYPFQSNFFWSSVMSTSDVNAIFLPLDYPAIMFFCPLIRRSCNTALADSLFCIWPLHQKIM